MANLENQGNRGNRWESEEIAGRGLLKTVGKRRKRFEKRHEMEARQSFENLGT